MPVLTNRGQWLPRPDGRQVLVTVHPSSLLRGAAEDREPAFAAFTGDLAHARELSDRRAG